MALLDMSLFPRLFWGDLATYCLLCVWFLTLFWCCVVFRARFALVVVVVILFCLGFSVCTYWMICFVYCICVVGLFCLLCGFVLLVGLFRLVVVLGVYILLFGLLLCV